MEQYKYITAKIGSETITRCKYAYIDIYGNEFLTFSRTLDDCRRKRDEWIASNR